MRHIYTVLFFALSLSICIANNPMESGLNSINKQSAQAYISFLASDALQGRGAGTQAGLVTSEYLASFLMDLGISPVGDTYFQPFEAYNQDFQKKRRYTVNPDSITKYKEGIYRKLEMRNVLGIIPGINTNQYVVIGAHFDHLGKDENLVGDKIYNGADDNASGVSAVMQIAKAFVQTGVKPRRNVIFAFWDGEEEGLLGSKFFTQNCSYLKQIVGYLNFDMIGRNTDESNPSYFVYFYTEANPSFATWLKDDILQYNLNLEPDYHPWKKPVGGSDNGSFAQYDIPIIWYHTDGHPDYHTPRDETSKINWNKIVDITKASFLNAWNLANLEEF